MTFLSTNAYRLNSLLRLKDDITLNKEFLYLFVGDFTTHANTEPNALYDIPRETLVKTYDNMIEGKQVTSSDLNLVVRYVPWGTDTVFDMYDDADIDLPTKDFYVITEEGSNFNVWKCLDNNQQTNSTVQPQFSDITGANTILYQTSDGYRWKYLTTVDSTTVATFKVGINYFPVLANTDVATTARPGSLNIFKVENEGKRYDNYVTGSFKTSDIALFGRKDLFNISNTIVSAIDGYYTGCLFYISGISGAKGQYSTVIDYVSNSTGTIITLDTPLATLPVNGDTYEIYPGIDIIGDNFTDPAIARALVNASSSNTIYRIEVLDPGEGYHYVTAEVIANSVVGVTNNAIIRPILAPPGGHGADIFNELYVHDLCLSVTLANTESSLGFIPATNIYQQFGILRNPVFANVQFGLTTVVGTFQEGEELSLINPQLLTTNVTTIRTSNVVTTNASLYNFVGTVVANQFVYISSTDHQQNQLNQIASITNSSQIVLYSNMNFTAQTASKFINNVIVGNGGTGYNNTDVVTIANGTVAAVGNPTTLSGGNIQSVALTSQGLYSATKINSDLTSAIVIRAANGAASNGSGASLTANLTTQSVGTGFLYDANIIANCSILSVPTANTILVDNVSPKFEVSGLLIGQTSGATGFISAINRNGVAKQYRTFVSMYKYTATNATLSFVPGEMIVQGNTSAQLHSFSGSGTITLYVNNFTSEPFEAGPISGQTSGATAIVSATYAPEIVWGSGEIQYLENIDAVTRQPNQKEQFQVVFNA